MYNEIYNCEISWGTSRGVDTYGYNICRLKQDRGLWRTIGGGYDMVGTVVGDWFTEVHQEALAALIESHKDELVDCGYCVEGYLKIPAFYGLTVSPDGKISLDGACGINCMESVMKACGFEVEHVVNNEGHVTNYLIQKSETVKECAA
jgi:hypothetical protein